MKKYIILISLLMIMTLESFSINFNENTKIRDIFKSQNISGTFVIYDNQDNSFTGYNENRSLKEFIPASTFKIYNSLFALSEEVIEDVDETFYYYDGSKVFLNSWEADANLRQAIKISHVPAYQQLAREIGIEDMKKHIHKLKFGNEDIGDKVDNFWLKGPLKISAIDQTKLLSRLGNRTLPYPKNLQDLVSEITLLDSGNNWELHGKTGWSGSAPDPIGWFVGWVEEDGKIYSFAINMDLCDSKDLPKREEVAIKSLKAIGLLQN